MVAKLKKCRVNYKWPDFAESKLNFFCGDVFQFFSSEVHVHRSHLLLFSSHLHLDCSTLISASLVMLLVLLVLMLLVLLLSMLMWLVVTVLVLMLLILM